MTTRSLESPIPDCLRTTRAPVASGGGVFGGYKGTCAIIGRGARAIGRDISTWLGNPTDGAELGDP